MDRDALANTTLLVSANNQSIEGFAATSASTNNGDDTTNNSSSDSSSSFGVLGIVLVVIGGALLVLLAVVAAIKLRQRRKPSSYRAPDPKVKAVSGLSSSQLVSNTAWDNNAASTDDVIAFDMNNFAMPEESTSDSTLPRYSKTAI